MKSLFTAIENLRGENLASAILRYLIVTSPEIRREVLKLISKRSPREPVVSDSHFSCYLELPTKFESENHEAVKGRIDIVLELDDALVGIEAKFFAGFSDGQPFKYYQTLEKQGKLLGELRRTDPLDYFVCVLVPASRVRSAEKDLKKKSGLWSAHEKRHVVISWQEMREALERAEKHATAEIAYFSRMYRGFLEEKLMLLRDWDIKQPHFTRRWQPSGTALQYELVAELFQVLNTEGKRLQSVLTRANGWVCQKIEGIGSDDDAKVLWYGFCPQGKVSGDIGGGAEFYVVSTVEPDETPDPEVVIRRGRAHEFEGWRDGCVGWNVDLEKVAGTPDAWSQVLSPFLDALVAKLAPDDESSDLP